MKKVFIILISLILLSGCTVYYDINIDENLIITENISYIEEDIRFDEETSMTKEEYEGILRNLKISAQEHNYEFIDKTQNNNVDISLVKETPFKNFNDPFFLNGKYEKFNTSCNEKLCSLTASVIENTNIGDGDLIYFNIGISVPYEVLKHNASYYDEQKNVYYWYHSPIDEQKNIELVFKNGGKNIIKSNETKAKTKSIFWVIIGLIISSVIVSFGYKIYKNSKPML